MMRTKKRTLARQIVRDTRKIRKRERRKRTNVCFFWVKIKKFKRPVLEIDKKRQLRCVSAISGVKTGKF